MLQQRRQPHDVADSERRGRASADWRCSRRPAVSAAQRGAVGGSDGSNLGGQTLSDQPSRPVDHSGATPHSTFRLSLRTRAPHLVSSLSMSAA